MADCCINFDCSGVACSHFSAWLMNGADDTNTDNCKIYVIFDHFGAIEQIELYSDTGYVNLVAIGQLTVGTIVLEERNSSGLSGTVVWDGIAVTYPSYVTLFCNSSSSSSSKDSSSSSDSIDSSSSSSTSQSSFSSSSSGCCNNPICIGVYCSNFASWLFSGMNDNNSDNCVLYVSFEYFDDTLRQQVRIYKDSERSNLVAIGQGASGTIVLEERNSSGLSGTVVWNSTPVRSPHTAILDCAPSSSSSSSVGYSSSSSSSAGYSSSSSSSFGYSSSSSSSSVGYSSSSSSVGYSSSSSSSSSSSIDSSSSSSVDSSSSSSSKENRLWNRIKPLNLAMSAIGNFVIKNRLAQTITVIESTYSIGNVYLYFYGPYGDTSGVTINVRVCTCNDDGKPLTVITTKTLSGGDIVEDGWYSVDFSISGVTPSNQFLSFVVWQTGGDEDNFVAWGYNNATINNTSAWISCDGITWVEQESIVRALKLVADFDAYDLDNFKMVTPPAVLKETTQVLDENIEIEYPKYLNSIVVDSSGSMGWNDRFDTRKDFINKLIDKLKQNYSSDMLIDVVRIGSKQVDIDSIYSNVGMASTINLDLNTPTKTTYILTTSSASAEKDAVYVNNGETYTVARSVTNGTSFVCISDIAPLASGTMVRQSGVGDNTIIYTSFETASIVSNSIVAHGFKNLENGHNYILGDINLDNTTFDSVSSTNNWQTFLKNGGNITLTEGFDGPQDQASISLTANDDSIIRKPLSSEVLLTTKITDIVSEGDAVVTVENTDGFTGDSTIVLVDYDIWSDQYDITSIDSSTQFTMTPVASRGVGTWSDFSGIVQLSNISQAITIDGTTMMLLIKDSAVTRNITYYLETIEGYTIEWEIKPFSEWIVNSLYWLGRTALFPVSVFDVDGNPFPDGTKIEFFVDKVPEEAKQSDEIESQFFTVDASIGDDVIYLVSTTGYARNDNIDIVDDTGNVQHVRITEVGDSITNPYIKINPVLKFNFTIANGSRIVLKDTEEDAQKYITDTNRLPSTVGMVDITPMFTGTQLDTHLLQPYDPPQIDPSTGYDDLNLATEYIRMNIQDVPTNKGYAVIRVLPITEDNLKTIYEKSYEESRILRYEPKDSFLTISGQLVQNEADIEKQQEYDQNNIPVVETTTTTTLISNAIDYTVETPVFLKGGYAEGSMISFASDLTEELYAGIDIAGTTKENNNVSEQTTILIKSYEIFPSLVLEDFNGTVIAKQFFEPFDVDFTPPVNIVSDFDGSNISYLCQNDSSTDCPARGGYISKEAPGIYASSGDSFTIDYIITDENVLIKDGTLNIKIYSNPLIDLEAVACCLSPGKHTDEEYADSFKRNDLNVIYPITTSIVNGESVSTQELSDIDKWRTVVENNPYSYIIEEKQNTEGASVSSGLYQDLAVDTLTNAGLIEEDVSEDSPSFEWYVNPSEWIFATQYDATVYNQTIDIVNGRATLEVPASDVNALLMIQASVVFGEDDRFETIKSDLVFSANPLNIEAISPIRIEAVGGNTLYELSTNITWEGLSIADDVVVNVTPPFTSISPAVGKTSNGRVAGLFIGPHSPVSMTECDNGIVYGTYEDIEINVSYMGYELTVSRYVEWVGALRKSGDEDGIKAFQVNSSGSNFSDGSMLPQIFFSDLDVDPLNIIWLGEEGIEALKGVGQEGELPRIVSYRGYGLPNRVRFLSGGYVETSVIGLNQNIGHIQSQKTSSMEDNQPWKTEVLPIVTYINNDGQEIVANGVRIAPYFDIKSDGTGVWMFPGPFALYTEPLSISLFLESYELDEFGRPTLGKIKRDGLQKVKVVASVKWKDEPINGWYIDNDGKIDQTSRWVGFPDVQFIGGTCEEVNADVPVDSGGEDPEPIKMKDVRNTIGGCLLVGSHPDIKLSSGVVTTSLSRTDIYEDENTPIWIPDIIVDGVVVTPAHWEMVVTSSHYHNITVDTDGSGTTTDTIVLYGVIADHIHTITDYETASGGIPSHIHELNCVAIVDLEPLTNTEVDIAINGYVRYDPTSCQRISVGGTSPLSSSFAYPGKENRMMFATVYNNGVKTSERASRGFVFEISTEDKTIIDSSSSESSGTSIEPSPLSSVFTAYTAEQVTDTDRGFDIKVKASYTGYYKEDPVGTFTWIPETPVPDGSRITFDIKLYKPLQDDTSKKQNSILIMDPNVIRKYMIMDINASIYSDGYNGESSTVVEVNSFLQWVPSVDALVSLPTNDSIYLNSAVNQIYTIGASQIHDAVRLAANRLIQYQTDNSSWKDSKKTIYLLTDGDENTASYSIDQAINTVNFIDGIKEVPVIPVKFGYSLSSDDILMKEYASETGGTTISLVDPSDTELDDIIDDIITSGTTGVNERIYNGSFDLNKNNIISEMSLGGVTLPIDSRVLFRIRYSSDNITWSAWSDWQDSSGNIDLEIEMASRGRYLQYELKLLGNSDFESPIVTEGPTIEYYDSQNFKTFFQPVDLDINTDEYLASIHITHQAFIPHTSEVTYGYTQFNTTDLSDYSSIVRSEITPDRHTIMPTRFNERFLTEDRKKYTAINGKWTEGAFIEIYRINSLTLAYSLVDPSEYIANNVDGTITFYTTQDQNDIFMLSVYFDSLFRILCNVTNYGPETTSIDYIGLLYNIAKRIPKDNQGNIIHVPIDMRIE